MEPLMTFVEALTAMREGKSVTRLAWPEFPAQSLQSKGFSMEPLMTFVEALTAMREGKSVTRLAWPEFPAQSLVLIPGREIEASFPPMVTHLGQGTMFTVEDHVDCIYRGEPGYIYTTVGYQFSQADILTNDWRLADQ